ncbi:MAG: preprotein translocase subunit Tim44 [Alphaproteobacteria bacterium HGW-Alphaproteobacteria-4]|nr:MAG: preprotein translocase subunit Tim44 [Alphaproteobacteria bacterium HGW-Alphaproteobacteria-4]
MSNAVIQLIVLAGIAIFLILRLKNVLGTREGFEKPDLPEIEPATRSARRGFAVIEGGQDRDITDHVPEGSPAALALAAMKRAEPSFSVTEFLQGARGAYEMILMAFERSDIAAVRPFLAPEVYAAFDAVVQTRAQQGLTVQAEFIGVRELALEAAEYDPKSREAEISVRYLGELISSARDAAGQVVEGDPKSPRKQRDTWTFARKMGAKDPNWQLVATSA